MTQNSPETSILLTYDEVMNLLRISRTTVWRLIKTGQLDQIKIGSRALVTRASVERFCSQDDVA